jgi:hypothetical protein
MVLAQGEVREWVSEEDYSVWIYVILEVVFYYLARRLTLGGSVVRVTVNDSRGSSMKKPRFNR